jgi:S-DNA-T family DNA segregation ATPase FtsK/SpoIIIE
VSPEELARLTNFWSTQARPQATEVLTFAGEEDSSDPLLNQARKLAREGKPISVSYLQRQLRIGFPRAEQLVKMLEQEGSGEGAGSGKSEQAMTPHS